MDCWTGVWCAAVTEPRRSTRPTAASKAKKAGASTQTKAARARHAAGENICGATRRDGKVCEHRAGYGTSHPGRGACKHHGGGLPSNRVASLRAEAHEQFGAWADIDPAEAIMLCIRITAGEVFWFDAEVARLEAEEIVVYETSRTEGHGPEGPVDVTTTTNRAQLNILIKERQLATDRLFRYSKEALALGLEERRVRMAEQWGQLVGGMLRSVLDELKLTAAQQALAPDVVRRHLLALEAPRG